jgi:hypothetical protein
MEVFPNLNSKVVIIDDTHLSVIIAYCLLFSILPKSNFEFKLFVKSKMVCNLFMFDVDENVEIRLSDDDFVLVFTSGGVKTLHIQTMTECATWANLTVNRLFSNDSFYKCICDEKVCRCQMLVKYTFIWHCFVERSLRKIDETNLGQILESFMSSSIAIKKMIFGFDVFKQSRVIIDFPL